MHLVILSGKAGVGKTTLANHIAEYAFNNGLRPKVMSFAGAWKREAEELGFPKDKEPEKYREYCQRIGREKREQDPDHWVKMFHQDLLEVMAQEIELLRNGVKYWETVVIVDDCRYLNEVAYGKHHDATQIFIVGGERTLPNDDAQWREDPSEELANLVEQEEEEYQELYDWIVYNNESLESLLQRVKKALPMWCGLEPSPMDEDEGETWLEFIESHDDVWEKMMDLFDKFEESEEDDAET